MKTLRLNTLIKAALILALVLALRPIHIFAGEIIDTIKPEISLKGDPVMTVERFSTFIDPGVNAFDGQSGIEKVVNVGEVDSLVPNTLHILTYTAYDFAGNYSSIIRTINVVDTTSPSKVTNLAVTTTVNSAVLTWALPDDRDFISLNVYRSEVPGELGSLLVSGFKSNKVTDSGLISGKTYYYSIESVDDQGLTSPAIGISATTLVVTPVSNSTNVPQESVLNSSTDQLSVTPEVALESKEQAVLGSFNDDTDTNKEAFFGKKVLGLKVWAWGIVLLVVGALSVYYIVKKILKITR